MESLRGAPRGGWVGCRMGMGVGEGTGEWMWGWMKFCIARAPQQMHFPGLPAASAARRHEARCVQSRVLPLGGKTGLLRCALPGSSDACAPLRPAPHGCGARGALPAAAGVCQHRALPGLGRCAPEDDQQLPSAATAPQPQGLLLPGCHGQLWVPPLPPRPAAPPAPARPPLVSPLGPGFPAARSA